MKIKIGDQQITVEEVADINGQGRLAEYNQSLQRIQILNWLSPDLKRNCLLHELLHALCTHSSFRNTSVGEHEEYLVELFSNQLCMMFNDNPHLKEELFLND